MMVMSGICIFMDVMSLTHDEWAIHDYDGDIKSDVIRTPRPSRRYG